MTTRRDVLKVTAGASALAALPLGWRSALAQDTPTIRVGSKNFPEAIIIGEMYALLLEHAGATVERKLNLGDTAIAHEALVSGSLDLYPEYTGTGLLAVLGASMSDVPGLGATPEAMGSPEAMASPSATSAADAVYAFVKEQYQAQFNLVWLDQSAMNDTQALAVKRSFSEEHGVTTISELVALSTSVDLVFSAPADFEEREDGMVGLRAVYGDFEATVNGVAPGIKYQALLDDDANVVLAFSTDAEIAINDLVVLVDDRALWPPYYVAPVVRQDALDANAGIADALNVLAPILTTEAQTQLNARVVGDEKAEPAAVARDFLVEQGLIAG